MQKSTVLIVSLVLAGCSNTSSIQPVESSESGFEGAVFEGETVVLGKSTPGNKEFRVFHQAATGFISVQTVRNSAEKRVNSFCGRTGEGVNVLRETTSQPPHILGNFPRIEIVFECVAKQSGELSTTFKNSKYSELTELKRLLDDGVLTQEEFDVEKAKVLDK